MKPKTSCLILPTTMISLVSFLIGCGASSSSKTKQTRNLKSQQASVDFSPTLNTPTSPKKATSTSTHSPVVSKKEHRQPEVEIESSITEPSHPQEGSDREVETAPHHILIQETNDEINRQEAQERPNEQNQIPDNPEHNHVATIVEEGQDIPIEETPTAVDLLEHQSQIVEDSVIIANQNQETDLNAQRHAPLANTQDVEFDTEHDTASSIETAASRLDQESLQSEAQDNHVISDPHSKILICNDFDDTAAYSNYFRYDGSNKLNEDEINEYEGIFLYTTEASQIDDIKGHLNHAITLAQKLKKSVMTDSITYALLLPVEAIHTPEHPQHKSLWPQLRIPLLTALGVSGAVISYMLTQTN